MDRNWVLVVKELVVLHELSWGLRPWQNFLKSMRTVVRVQARLMGKVSSGGYRGVADGNNY